MQGVEIAHMEAAKTVILKAYYDLRHSTAGEALQKTQAYGKFDTRAMDGLPEITIFEGLGAYDNNAVVITEEIGTKWSQFHDNFNPIDPVTPRTAFICDPTDRSNQLGGFLATFPKNKKLRDILGKEINMAIWERMYGGPASVTGPTSAITCVRRGFPIFAVILNYITQCLIISCAAGNRIIKLPNEYPDFMTLEYILENGQPLIFPCLDGNFANMKKFVTFLGDVGKTGYLKNFTDSGLMTKRQMDKFLHYGLPGGPSRALYLSSLQPRTNPIGFVLANGEKIGEWIHWLPFLRYARSQNDDSQPALVLYEVFQDRPWTKEGVLMSTPPNYSVFRESNGKLFVDTKWLLGMKDPSKCRATLILAPYDNRWAMSTSGKSGYRQIRF